MREHSYCTIKFKFIPQKRSDQIWHEHKADVLAADLGRWDIDLPLWVQDKSNNARQTMTFGIELMLTKRCLEATDYGKTFFWERKCIQITCSR